MTLETSPNVLFQSGLELDTSIKVLYSDGNGESKSELREETVLAHKMVLAKSTFFRQLIRDALLHDNSSVKQCLSLELDLSMVPDAVSTFKTFLNYLYGAQIDVTMTNPQSLLCLAKLCEVPSLEVEVKSQLATKATLMAKLFELMPLQMSPSPTAFTSTTSPFVAQSFNPDLYTTYLQLLSQTQNTPIIYGFNGTHMPTSALPTTAPFPFAQGISNLPVKSATAMEISRNDSSPTEISEPSSSTGKAFEPTELLPSTDKEGWCRNKKYIETMTKGYRCTVCNKVYGRYNSVSYHVTIYHRNPPIQCDEPGCNFTTREARYIHFHKYYKHQVPLPGNIDLDSRKCRFPSCRHVSKSPAMLEKHLARHLTVKLRSDEILPTLKGQMSGKA